MHAARQGVPPAGPSLPPSASARPGCSLAATPPRASTKCRQTSAAVQHLRSAIWGSRSLQHRGTGVNGTAAPRQPKPRAAEAAVGVSRATLPGFIMAPHLMPSRGHKLCKTGGGARHNSGQLPRLGSQASTLGVTSVGATAMLLYGFVPPARERGRGDHQEMHEDPAFGAVQLGQGGREAGGQRSGSFHAKGGLGSLRGARCSRHSSQTQGLAQSKPRLPPLRRVRRPSPLAAPRPPSPIPCRRGVTLALGRPPVTRRSRGWERGTPHQGKLFSSMCREQIK